MSTYQISVLGRPTDKRKADLRHAIAKLVEPFDLKIDRDIVLLNESEPRDPKLAQVAVYFGADNPGTASAAVLASMLREHVPIIPAVEHLEDFHRQIPQILHFANGVELAVSGNNLQGLAAPVLECLGLLRRERRVFVSYRRGEATDAALQIYGTLSKAGFDVFLDTHAVRPGEDFQAVLWHRLCDSDVVVMLDTPGYFKSKWTAAELGRALAKRIAVVGIVWPGHSPERETQLREPIYLDANDLHGAANGLTPSRLQHIRERVEIARSRSLAIRHAALAGSIVSAAEQIGGTFIGTSKHRVLTVKLPGGTDLQLLPTVGIPTARTFQAAEEQGALGGTRARGDAVVAYDHIGLHADHKNHLHWLEKNLGGRRALRVSSAAWELGGWEAGQ